MVNSERCREEWQTHPKERRLPIHHSQYSEFIIHDSLLAPVLSDIVLGLTIDRPAPESLSPVPHGLALGQRNLALDQIVFRIESQGDNRQAFLPRSTRQL